MLKTRAVRKALLIAACILAAYAAICLLLAYTYVHPVRRIQPPPDGLLSQEIPAQIHPIPAWITPNLAAGHPSQVVFVLVHGYGGSRASWADLALALKQKGQDSVIPAMPGQDASPWKRVGFGPKEAQIVTQTAEWARQKGATKVVLVGVSMGGSACWLAVQSGAPVDAVVTEAAYASFPRAMNRWLDRILPAGSILLRPLVWFAAPMARVDPNRIMPIRGAQAWRGKPALVIQDGDDSLMEPWHADQLAQAANCEKWIVPAAPHAAAYETDPVDFLTKVEAIAAQCRPNSLSSP